jgi:hypothetical protein
MRDIIIIIMNSPPFMQEGLFSGWPDLCRLCSVVLVRTVRRDSTNVLKRYILMDHSLVLFLPSSVTNDTEGGFMSSFGLIILVMMRLFMLNLINLYGYHLIFFLLLPTLIESLD